MLYKIFSSGHTSLLLQPILSIFIQTYVIWVCKLCTQLKFQEKLQELAPIPDLLKSTQMRLKDSQQAQAIAEHNAEQLARELNVAREKVTIMHIVMVSQR